MLRLPMDRDPSVLIGYVVAVASVALALAVKYVFGGLGADHLFVLLPAAVIVAAWYGGRGPGLLAAMLAAIGADILFLLPAGMALLTEDLFALAALIAEAVLIVEITVRLRKARAMAALDALAGEVRVFQRTTEHWIAEARPTATDR